MNFVRIELRLLEGVHIGAGRAGMVSRAQGFVPGHVVAYAIAAVLGRCQGGKPEDYDQAIKAVRHQCRCGPLFIQADEPEDSGQTISLLPRRDRARIERDYLIGVNHTALDGSVRRHLDGGLFEVEAIAPCRQHQARQPTLLAGGLWLEEGGLVLGEDLKKLLAHLVLGGERNAGLGRVALHTWDQDARAYAGLGQIQGEGLLLETGQILPGPALEGVTGTGWQPWFGRLHDNRQGAGRRFSDPVMIRLDGQVPTPTTFVLETAECGFGCWKPLCPAS
ncbi:MAG: hypothetical protein EOM92_13680 [Gammaproteobacteria bacterium]|nr:hypothetical protein [Gammaproteobacteria bacterium]